MEVTFDRIETLPLFTQIKMLYSGMHSAEKKVADYLLANSNNMFILTLVDLADRAGVSEATIVRFCRRFGVSGFAQFKILMARQYGGCEVVDAELVVEDLFITKDDGLEVLPERIIFSNINGLKDTLTTLNREELKRAIEAVQNARQVNVFGVGNSYAVTVDICIKLTRIGIICSSYSDSHQQMIAAGNMTNADVAIGVSHSGYSADTVEALQLARRTGATTICISNQFASPIIGVSDIKLLSAATETSFNSETMVSRISQLAIVDMIYCGIILKDYDLYTKRIANCNEYTANKAFKG
jgi:RpiR family transcriptional regulator, carbohydrate utilization regulator